MLHLGLQVVVPSHLAKFTHSAGEPYDVDQLVVKYYCSCVNCGFKTLQWVLGRVLRICGGVLKLNSV